jgi:prepilin-type N-terminal cleavage/methylation domain-containing protein
MRLSKKAFTLVEMLVALAVSSIIVAATYASFELIQKQYKKNIDVAELHTSGRAIMSILEREIRMAGYEYRDGNGLMTYGPIAGPLIITDSGDKCCDEVTIIYDEVYDTLNASGIVTSSTVERVKTRFWTESYSTSKRGNRHRLYKRRTILGTGNALLATPRSGSKEIMADYIDDLQLNFVSNTNLFVGMEGSKNVTIINPSTNVLKGSIADTFNISALIYDGVDLLYAGVNRNHGIKILNPSTRSRTAKTIGPGYVSSLAFDSVGRLYAGINQTNFIGPRKDIQIIDPSDGKIIGTIAGTPNTQALAFNSLGQLYVGGVGNIKIINPSTKATIGTIPNTAAAHSLAFDRAGNLYAGFNARNIQIINPSTKKIIGSIPNTTFTVALAFDSAGTLYASQDNNVGVLVINPSTRMVTSNLANSSTSDVQALAFQTKKLGNGSTISINLTLRTTGQYGKDRQFLKKDYFYGNFNMNKNDKYMRDTFSTVVSVRNL